MNTEELLADTFVAHEKLAPDAEQVLAAVRAHTRRSFARPLAMVASVALVAGAAVGAVALGHRSRGTAAQHPKAASSPHVAPRHAARAEPLTMPYDLGWLPAGSVHNDALRDADAGGVVLTGGAEYMLTITTANGPLLVDVQQMPLPLAEAQFKCGPGADVRIDGRPGLESANAGGACGYEIYFEDAVGGVMYVNVAPEHGNGDAADLTATGRRIAENVRFPGHTRVQPAFGLSYLPAGTHITGFDVEAVGTGLPAAGGAMPPLSTSYGIGGSARSAIDVALGNVIVTRDGTPGRSVQGHATSIARDGTYVDLLVHDAVGGFPVVIRSETAPLAELYRIADGLVLPR